MVAQPFVAPRLCSSDSAPPIPGLRARTMQNETQIPGLGLARVFTSDELQIGNESKIWASKMLSGL